MLVLLATDICRMILKTHAEDLLTTLENWSSQRVEVVISSISYAELVAGALLTENREKHMQLIKEFCERLDDIVPWDSGAVDVYTKIQTQAMRSNQNLNMNDAMLAAHALSLNAKLITSNGGNFSKISNLEVQVWEK